MDGLTVQGAVVIATPVVIGLVWLIRLEGRVNTHDKRHEDLKADVQYIRARIDQALNGHE